MSFTASSRSSSQYALYTSGMSHCWFGSCAASRRPNVNATTTNCRFLTTKPVSKSNILHVFACVAQQQKLHVLDTVNTSRNRSFADHFLFVHSANARKKRAVRYRHVAYTGHHVSFRDARGRHKTRFRDRNAWIYQIIIGQKREKTLGSR